MKRLLTLILLVSTANADVTTNNPSSTQNNTSGTNTAIQSYEAATTYQSGSSSNTTTNATTNNSSNLKTAVNPANAPAMSIYSQSSCTIPLSLGMTVIGFSASMGNYYMDEACELRRKAELLNKLGMKVAAVSLLCQDEAIFEAMAQAGTWCPHQGKIGKSAEEGWKKELSKPEYSGKRSMTWNAK